MNYKIGILIPCTSRNRDWKTTTDSYLYMIFLKSFLLTYDKEYEYTIYIGLDEDDDLFNNEKERAKIYRFVGIMKNVNLLFINVKVEKGHVTEIWNILCKKAYNQGCDYFYQSGDDIEFKSIGWVKDSILVLRQNGNIGVSGPIDMNNLRILTQSFVSRKHYDILGFYFPTDIKNWYCDDWITMLYGKLNKLFPLKDKYCVNMGGEPRYEIKGSTSSVDPVRLLCYELVERDLKKF